MSKYLELWREKIEATEEIVLSIGPAVIKSHVSILDLAAAGEIPQTLIGEIQATAKAAQRKGKVDDEALGNAFMANLPKYMPAIDAVIIATFVDPPVTREGDENSLPVRAIPFEDKMAVFTRGNRGADALRPFRAGEGEPGGVAHAGVGVSPAAVDSAGAESG